VLPLRGKIINSEKARYDKVLSHNEIRLLISALGTGIGIEEFDLAKLRYHKIILMTDADVDGAHIRTLLLTFFFRHMNALIEAGHLFIAQPPLFKVRKGKVEKYLMNEREFEDFFLSTWVEKSALKVPGKTAPLREQALLESLKYAVEYRNLFQKFVKRGLPAALVEGFLNKKFKVSKRTTAEDAFARSQEIMAGLSLRNWHVNIREGDNGDGAVLEITGDLPAQINIDTLKSPDYEILYELHEKMPPVYKGACTIIEESGKETLVKTVEQLISTVLEAAKAGATFQRYKGLGEMNPEQLWETTMNPETRTLLKVTMEDAVGADEMFTVLMGDAVEPRREFIEKHALDVANLDI
jgi:DNA gyrase subunit B